MGHFDKWVDVRLKKDPSGRSVYFPRAYWGNGRVIQNPEVEIRLRKFAVAYNIAWSFILLALVVLFANGEIQIFLSLASILFMYGVQFFWTRHILTDCPISEEKLTFTEFQKAEAGCADKIVLSLLTLVCIFFAAASSYGLITVQSLHSRAIGVFGLLFFGLGAAKFIYQLVLKREIPNCRVP